MIDQNAKAGPSRSPSDTVVNPDVQAPPATPPQTPGKTKRRSWFSFTSPSHLLSDSPEQSDARDKKHTKGEEEMELVEPFKNGTVRRSTDSQIRSTPRGRESIEVDGEEAEEVLTIDAEPEQTIKRKKSKRRSLKNEEDEGEVVRLNDLSGLSMRQEVARKSYDPGGAMVELPTAQNDRFGQRTFSRTASDRDPFAIPPDDAAGAQATPALPADDATDLSQSNVPTDVALSFAPSDRPLPPLPPADSDKALPQVPSGIFITPSSPHKLTKRPQSRPVGSSSSSHSSLNKHDRRSRSTSRSRGTRESSQSRTLRNVKSFNIGLGVPRKESDPSVPPAVPSKPQSVSSPLPSRGASPTPRIAFAEPEIMKTDRKVSSGTTDGDNTDTEKRGRAKRARSLSGLLSRPHIESRPNSRSTSPVQGEEQMTVKASGVLGWLGVKKTVKRRTSESKPGDSDHHAGRDSARSSVDASIGSRDGNASRESLRGQKTLKLRPNLLPQPSSVTAVPDTFDVDHSGRASRDGGSRDPSPGNKRGSRPAPINIYTPRHSFASSRSSLHFNRPDADAAVNPSQWPSSPTEQEETLFSPESIIWGAGVRPWMDGLDGRRSTRSSMSTPLGSLPEQGPLSIMQPTAESAGQAQTGRLRSWSDAPLPQPSTSRQVRSSIVPSSGSMSPMAQSITSPARPKMPGRSSSGNSVIMGKMRSVFGKSTSRGGSQTLFRQPSSDVDEFGAAISRSGYPSSERMRPSSSTSSFLSARPTSITDSAHMALHGSHNAERGIFSTDTPDRSPRTSFAAASVSSMQPFGAGAARPDAPIGRNGRVRASTMFSRPTSAFIPPPSPQVVPIAATPPRRRPSVMQRFSSGVLRSGQGSPRNSLFPLPSRSTGSMSSGFASPLAPDDPNSLLTGPRPSSGSITAAMGNISIKALVAREQGDTPETWLERVVHRVGRSDIADVLAASGDDFHSQALQLYMSQFDFTHNALDVALRRLLMRLSLPRETQQIDRIIEAFAARYETCEPGLFISKDNTYVLAFSMMMLHTDAFNRHNKNKMTKTDYVRNTRMDGVHPLVLEAFFDNITFTPFVFVEDDTDFGRESSTSSTFATVSSSALTSGTKNGKIDVYHMIVDESLARLRVNIESVIPAEGPYSCAGTSAHVDTHSAHQAFLRARDMVIVPPKRKTSAAALLGSTPSKSRDLAPEQETVLKVAKIGLLSRRHDSGEGKKSSRKWKPWSVILTSSQILFFKDTSMALGLLDLIRSSESDEKGSALPRMTNFKPDEVFPLKDGIAVYDRTETTPHTFRYVMPHHRQYFLQAASQTDMNEWVGLINYASTFKTTNIRIRGTTMGRDRAVLAGAAAAASHKRDMKIEAPTPERLSSLPRSPRKAVFGDAETADRPRTPTVDFAPSQFNPGGDTVRSKVADLDDANGVLNEGEQLEEVFDVVKAELAAGRGGAPRTSPSVDRPTKEHSLRRDLMQAQIANLERRVSHVDAALQSNLRLVRNLAILTPFQKATKERIVAAIPSVASRIRDIRLDLARLRTWVVILQRELEYEQQDMARLRHVALQAAARSLRDPQGVKAVVKDVNGGEPGVPVVALPDAEDDEDEQDRGRPSGEEGSRSSSEMLGRSPGELPILIRRSSEQPRETNRRTGRPEGPRQESTHSVLSYRSIGSDIKRSESSFLSARDALDRASPGDDEASARDGTGENGGSTPLFPFSDGEEESTIKGGKVEESALNGAAVGGDVDDVPEEWIKTRAARRVSLAHIPDIPPRLSSINAAGKSSGGGDHGGDRGQ